MVMLVISIAGVMVAPQLTNIAVSKAQFAIDQVLSDVRYAQMLAIETQLRTRVVFNAGTDSYAVQIETSPATWVAATSPFTKGSFTVTLNAEDYSGVDITTVSLNSASTVIFNSYGAPFNAAEIALTEPAFVELNSKYQMHFRAETGKTDLVVL